MSDLPLDQLGIRVPLLGTENRRKPCLICHRPIPTNRVLCNDCAQPDPEQTEKLRLKRYQRGPVEYQLPFIDVGPLAESLRIAGFKPNAKKELEQLSQAG